MLFRSIKPGLVVTASGRALTVGKFIAVGDELHDGEDNLSIIGHILNKFTSQRNLVTAKDVYRGDQVTLLTPSMDLLLTGVAQNVVFGQHKTTFDVSTVDGTVKVEFIPGLKSIVTDASGVIFVPENYPIVGSLDNTDDIRDSMLIDAMNINKAHSLLAAQALVSLGDKLSIGHDGIDYSLNGSHVGPAHRAIEMLIVNEGIEPRRAESFIKSAAERHKLVVLMSKKADFTPGEIPEFGDKPQPQSDVQMNGANIQKALDSGDKQIADAMVISELLQSPDLFGVIAEYLPDINEAVDRLGRVLFMSRVRMDQLVKASGNESAMSTIASVKAVYRNLGDNLVKLEQLISNVKAT